MGVFMGYHVCAGHESDTPNARILGLIHEALAVCAEKQPLLVWD